MERPYICIAGKNNIAVDILKHIIEQYGSDNICVVCNRTETGENGFQRSLRLYSRVCKIPEYKLDELYKIKNLLLISLEYDQIIKPELFEDARLYNIHFSLLPQYKGMYTSAHPILNGEKYAGVTLHEIDSGIDTGNIIAQERFEIGESNCRELYLQYIEYGTALVIRYIDNLIWNNYIAVKQDIAGSSYYSKKSINYNSISIDLNQTAEGIQRQIRAYTFREYQLPVVFGMAIFGTSVLKSRSSEKPGVLLFRDEDSIVVSTVDYDITLYFDKFEDLCEACRQGELNRVKEINSFNVKIINEKDEHGWSPLMIATYYNQASVVKYLITVGADIHAKNRNGTNLLMYAKEAYKHSGDNTLFKLYLKLGLSIKTEDYKGRNLKSYIDEENITLEELMK